MYGFSVQMSCGFDEAVDRVTEALKTEGFGVLTEIDVKATLKKKIDVDRKPYKILGACNPKLANQALNADPDIGLLLPCNVVVESVDKDHSLVRILDPHAMMQAGGFDEDPVLAEVGGEAEQRLRRVAEALRA